MRKPLTVDQNKLWKIFRDGNTRPPYLPPEKPIYAGQEATGLDISVFIPIPKKGDTKECSNCHTIAFISHANKVLKILQARLQQYMN